METLRRAYRSIKDFTRKRRTSVVNEEKQKTPTPKPEKTPRTIIQEQVNAHNESNTDFSFTFAPPNKINIHSKKEGTPRNKSSECAEITIKSATTIYLDNLYKCAGFSGTEILKLMEKFGADNGYKTIELSDASEIEGNMKIRSEKVGHGRCIIPLSFFSILATGETWYNKHGYASKYTEDEKAHNATIIKKTFKQFIGDICNRAESVDEKTKKKLIDGMNHFIKDKKERDTITVQELFTKIKSDMKVDGVLDCSDKNKKHNWVVDILQFIINYGASVHYLRDKKDDNIMLVATKQIKNL